MVLFASCQKLRFLDDFAVASTRVFPSCDAFDELVVANFKTRSSVKTCNLDETVFHQLQKDEFRSQSVETSLLCGVSATLCRNGRPFVRFCAPRIAPTARQACLHALKSALRHARPSLPFNDRLVKRVTVYPTVLRRSRTPLGVPTTLAQNKGMNA